ncbi:class I SAM-dependent methyltransferase [Actinocrispum sp. NPDC049592]|uniref:class I SAM-dependent methyltransferase n=1 Tax=Actinocrispum sp. NPDC049592 TaxID=3154835 RepID=UPI00342C39FD
MSRSYWDSQAATFDTAPDHGLTTPEVRRAWSDLLLPLIPAASVIADIACGTGTLTQLLASAGHTVHALDYAPKMITVARTKCTDLPTTFVLADATTPPYRRKAFDIVLARHILWTLPTPERAVANWTALLKPTGTLILIEGHWHTGAGLTPEQAQTLVHTTRKEATIHPLTNPALWGTPTTDTRYLLHSPH